MSVVTIVPAPGWRIIRDVGGVPGLHLATEVFSEAAERAFFGVTAAVGTLHPHETSRHGEFKCGVRSAPAAFWALQNLVRDCGLFPTLLDSDYALCWGYPPGASFKAHFDSRYNWGEHVMSV